MIRVTLTPAGFAALGRGMLFWNGRGHLMDVRRQDVALGMVHLEGACFRPYYRRSLSDEWSEGTLADDDLGARRSIEARVSVWLSETVQNPTRADGRLPGQASLQHDDMPYGLPPEAR